MPRSDARCTRRRSSMASWRMWELFSRRNFSTWSLPIRASWTAAIWRASNSDWVTMSPFTLTITFSMISPRAAAPKRTRLRMVRGQRGFMVHLGSGHQARDELLDLRVRFLAPEAGADLVAALVERGPAGALPRVDAQHVVPEGGLHGVADPPLGEVEGRLFQLRGELASGEGPHEAPRARLRGAGQRLGEGGEAARLLQQPALDVARLVQGRHQDLAEGHGLGGLQLRLVRLEVRRH